MLSERDYWVCWSQISGVGPISLQRLCQHFGNLKTAWEASTQNLQKVEGFGRQTVEKVAQQRAKFDCVEFLKKHAEKNPDFWTPADENYPRLLLEIPTPPPVLYYRGTVEPEENQGIKPTVGIVGTREPSEYGRRWTRKISTILAKSGFTIISGMAAGIDTEAHSSCLDAGGRTLAIFGTGVDIIYPKDNRKLSERVIKQGLVMSEYPAGTKPNARHFPSRNRIIAGLSRAVFVMEAGEKSGALITANVANDFCRDIYVLPGRLDDEKSQGCLKLINGGAGLIPVNLEELLEQLGAIPQLDAPEQLSLFESPPTPSSVPSAETNLELNLESNLAQVFQVISSEPTAFDVIVQKAELDTGIVSSSLLQLELLGLVSQLPGMRYQRNS
ncbi:DNA-processing protein DprA [Capilliphycus salinus ALCB114379]|uniref:DNA-processing protein DprA n=1 Tax=Capilliphycus salinus TaxID=2768948 RepID=UPI0039A70C6B